MPDDAGHDAVLSLVEGFADIARRVHISENFDDSLARITTTARRALPGCQSASISLLTHHGPPLTKGATDQLACDGDQIQYDEGEGPCLDAAMQERWIYTKDVATDPRWPRSAARLGPELGVHSMFSCRLTLDAAPHQTLGGLNLYSMTPDAFTIQDQMLAILLSSLGAVVVDAARHQENLRTALTSRQVIGEAIGVLRAQTGVSSDEAFQMLSRASQRSNTKLRDLALRITNSAARGPDNPL